MYLEKEALEFFRKEDILNRFIHQQLSGSPGDISSRKPGRNYEFEQYRTYQPGDDLRDVDWKVFARSDRLVVRNYGMDLRANTRIVIDSSASMDFPSGRPDSRNSKLETAKKTAAVLSHLLIRKKNNVSLSIISDKYHEIGKTNSVLLEKQLSVIKPAGRTDIRQFPERNPKEIVFFITDGWWGKEDWRKMAESLVMKRVHLMQILSREEIDFNLTGSFELTDLENASRQDVIPSTLRSEYRLRVRERIRWMGNRFLDAGLTYGLFPLDVKYYITLKETFFLRKHSPKNISGTTL